MTLSVSTVIDRTPDVVFDFIAAKHLQNHPRWDPAMELEQITEGPIGVGTRLHRRYTRSGTSIEGIMEVVEFDKGQTFGTVIHDNTPSGVVEVRSRATFEPHGGTGTNITIELDVAGMHIAMDPSMIQGSLNRMKELIEAET